MSRKKRLNSHLYGILKLECPLGHLLAKILMNDNSPEMQLYGTSAWGPGWKSERPLDEPLNVRCPACESQGVRMDLRGSWDKARELLTEISNDEFRSSDKYVLGG